MLGDVGSTLGSMLDLSVLDQRCGLLVVTCGFPDDDESELLIELMEPNVKIPGLSSMDNKPEMASVLALSSFLCSDDRAVFTG